MTPLHVVAGRQIPPAVAQQSAALSAAKRKLEPYYLECLDDIAGRCDIASGEKLLDALLGEMSVGNVRCFVVNFYRCRTGAK